MAHCDFRSRLPIIATVPRWVPRTKSMASLRPSWTASVPIPAGVVFVVPWAGYCGPARCRRWMRPRQRSRPPRAAAGSGRASRRLPRMGRALRPDTVFVDLELLAAGSGRRGHGADVGGARWTSAVGAGSLAGWGVRAGARRAISLRASGTIRAGEGWACSAGAAAVRKASASLARVTHRCQAVRADPCRAPGG